MSLFNILLKDFKSTDNQKCFLLNVNNSNELLLFYADTATNDIIKDLSNENVLNKAALIPISSNIDIIHPLYNASSILTKENIYIKSFKDRTGDASDLINTYSPLYANSNALIENIDNCIYTLMPMTKSAHILISAQILDYIIDNNLSSLSHDLSIYCFDSNTLSIISALPNISCNYIYEIDGRLKLHYAEGSLVGTTFKLKNYLDTTYSMNMPDNSHLKNCRQYIGIGKCGNTIFLKYLDNIDYTLLSGNLSAQNNGNTIQHIEVLDKINRHNVNSYPNSAVLHKSNLFSLKLENEGLKKLNNDLKTKIQQEIKNNVRLIVKSLCPVNSLLFETYFN